MFEAETWVAVAFFIFVGVLVYFRFHKSIVGGLDQRATVPDGSNQVERLGHVLPYRVGESSMVVGEQDACGIHVSE